MIESQIQVKILKINRVFLSYTLLYRAGHGLHLHDRNKYVSQDAHRFFADCSKLSADSKTRINIDSPFPIINVSESYYFII